MALKEALPKLMCWKCKSRVYVLMVFGGRPSEGKIRATEGTMEEPLMASVVLQSEAGTRAGMLLISSCDDL